MPNTKPIKENKGDTLVRNTLQTFFSRLVLISLLLSATTIVQSEEPEPGDLCGEFVREIRRIDTDDETEMLKTFKAIESRQSSVSDCKAYVSKQRYLDTDADINGNSYNYKRSGWHYLLNDLMPSMSDLELLVRFYDREAETKEFLIKAISLIELEDKNEILFSDQENDYTGITSLELFFLNETGEDYKKYPSATKLLVDVFSQTEFQMREDIFVPAAKFKIEQYEGTLGESYSIGYRKLLRFVRNSSLLGDF